MIQTRRRISPTRRNLVVDLGIFAAFLVAGAPHFTGMTIHEWLGIAFGAAIVTHIVLHWQWVVAVTKRFFSRMPMATRVNYVLNALLFVAITMTIFTGILISRSALPLMGLTLNVGHGWRQIHSLAADLSVLFVGLHVALHWRWIGNAFKTYILSPLAGSLSYLPTRRARGSEAQS